MRKHLFWFIIPVLFTTSFVLAADLNPAPSKTDNSNSDNGIIAAIKQLGTEIQSLAVAGTGSFNNMLYQVDQNLIVALKANGEHRKALHQAQSQAALSTQRQIDFILQEFPEQIADANQLTDPIMTADINKRRQLLGNLTTNIPGKDTLYLNQMTNPLAATSSVSKPNATYDHYFNFESLFSPFAYTSDQEEAARAYVQYAAQQYQSFADKIDFSKLKSTLNNLSPDKRAQALRDFVANPIYQNYQLTLRSLLAAKSIALSNLNQLLAERIPQKNLASKTGMPNNPQLPEGYASPLEVENYIANERVNSPEWFQQIKTAAPSAVQREQVLILAEIESLLQRNHLDNERILATLSLMALQSTQNSQTSLQTQVQNVNAIIDPKNAPSQP